MSEGTDGNDTLTGTAGDELLAGLAGNDSLAGHEGDDWLGGGAGRDTLHGGAGADTLEGGAGFDTAVFGGSIDGYRFGQSDGWLVVSDTNPTDGDDGTALLRGVEQLQFRDTLIAHSGNGEARVADTTPFFQSRAAAVQLADGGQVVAWLSYDDPNEVFEVFAQRYSSGGSPQGEQFRVNTEELDFLLADDRPAIAALDDGGFVVAWTLYAVDASDTEVRAQRFDAAGAPVGGEIPVNTTSGESQERPGVAALEDGGFVVCWSSWAQDGDGYGIFFQRFGADGAPLGGEEQANQYTESAQSDAAMQALPDGGFVVAWSSNGQDGAREEVYARRFDAEGNPQGDEFRVNTTVAAAQLDPAIAVREDGTVAIAWTGEVAGNAFEEILLQVYDPDGTAHGGEVRVNLTPGNYQYEPALAFVPGTGELVVTWTSDAQDGSAEGVYARVFAIGVDATVAGGAEFGVTTNTSDTQRLPAVSGFGDAGFLVAWTSTGQDDPDGSSGVFLQRFVRDASDAGSPAAPWSFELPRLRGTAADERFDLTGTGGDLSSAGQGGNDVYVLDSLRDRVFEGADKGIDRIETALAWSLSGTPHVEDLRLLGSADAQGSGNAAANRVWGNDGRNLLRGAGGDDTLDGGEGADTLVGGRGDDTYVVRDGLDTVAERSGGGIDTLQSERVETRLPVQVENLVLSGSGALDGYGNRLANVLTGSAIANLLDGAAGADTMAGGRGDDIYRVDEAGDRVVENIGEGADTVLSRVSFTLPAHVEQLKLAGDGALDGSGNFLANVIEGNDAANVLDGATGADVLIGLGGNDTYYVDQSADTVIETAGGGVDTVIASEAFTLPEFVERIRFVDPQGGTRNYSGVGNGADNLLEGAAGDDALNGLGGNDTLLGYAGDDTLTGGEGADSMLGGAGDDVYAIDDAGDVYVELAGEGAADEVRASISHTLLANVEHLRLLGAADIDGAGNASANRVDGNSGGNGLTGADGNDTLDGGEGVDTMDGGDGDDVYYVDEVDDIAEESDPLLMLSPGAPQPAAGGTNIDTVISQVSYTLRANIENLELAGDADLVGTGNELDNLLSGNSGANLLRGGDGVDILDGGAGNDTLDGGSGRDTLGGGSGDDVYVVSAGDSILESARQGTDTVQAGVAWTLANQLENLVLGGSANIDGAGNGAANTLRGNAGRNQLAGAAGNDSLVGAGGADTLSGGAGRDTLTGGAGGDAFRFDAALASGNADLVTDFVRGSDLLVLDADVFTQFGAGVAVTANQLLSGAGLTGATTAEHRLIYNASTGALYYDPDGTGASAAVRFAVLGTDTSPAGLAATDFLIAD